MSILPGLGDKPSRFGSGKGKTRLFLMAQNDIAGDTVVNKRISEKLGLHFESKNSITTRQGVSEERMSLGNVLEIGDLSWKDLALTEVGSGLVLCLWFSSRNGIPHKRSDCFGRLDEVFC